MNRREPLPISPAVQNESVILSLHAAYQTIGKTLEQRIQVPATRGWILASFRGGPSLNQNQIATLLGIDRTVVHRTVKALIKEGLLKETPAPTGRSLLLSLSDKGETARQELVRERKALEEEVRAKLGHGKSETLLSLLRTLAAQPFEKKGHAERGPILIRHSVSTAAESGRKRNQGSRRIRT
ncbi:MAG TPA: MarR family winged helix-turn-helix transcriptional regulator [Opitutaceae bacterium]|jgi:DNA-binding MarR family transcriptional regulator